jgi:hypothetical protein
VIGRRAPGSPSKIPALALVVLAVALWPGTAASFCRTTTVSVSATFNPARSCFNEGLPLFWRSRCVGYSVSRGGTQRFPLDVVTQTTASAFRTWTSVACPEGPAGIAMTDLGPADCAVPTYDERGPNQNLIVLRETWPYNDPNNTLGLTTVTFDIDSGELYDADLEINASVNLTALDPVPADGYDLASLLTHEAGHFLGLAHATLSTSTMFASYKPGSSTGRGLMPDDIAGLCAVYPNAGERSAVVGAAAARVPSGTCDPTPRHGWARACHEDGDHDGCSVSPHATPGAVDPTSAAIVALLALARRVLRGRLRSPAH